MGIFHVFYIAQLVPNRAIILPLKRKDAAEYSEPLQTSKISLFMKTVSEWKLLTLFARHFILDVHLRCFSSEYVPEIYILISWDDCNVIYIVFFYM